MLFKKKNFLSFPLLKNSAFTKILVKTPIHLIKKWNYVNRGVITLEHSGQMLHIKTQFCAPIEYFLSEIHPELKTS